MWERGGISEGEGCGVRLRGGILKGEGLCKVGVSEWEGCGIKVWLVGNGRVIAFG